MTFPSPSIEVMQVSHKLNQLISTFCYEYTVLFFSREWKLECLSSENSQYESSTFFCEQKQEQQVSSSTTYDSKEAQKLMQDEQ